MKDDPHCKSDHKSDLGLEGMRDTTESLFSGAHS